MSEFNKAEIWILVSSVLLVMVVWLIIQLFAMARKTEELYKQLQKQDKRIMELTKKRRKNDCGYSITRVY